MPYNKSRTSYFDGLNIFACFAVLALHHNGIVHNYNVNTIEWAQALGFEVAFYWAVPIFFMLTGATLFNYRDKYTTNNFFIKRISRAVFPFLLWSVILLLHSWFIGKFQYKSLQEIINVIFTTRVTHGDIYWFFIPLISLYCLIPVLSLLKDKREILWYMVIFIFVTHSCFPILFKFLGIRYNNSISFPMNGYVLFLLLGYLFSTIEITRKQRLIIYFLGGSCALIRYFGTYYFSLANGKVDKILFGYIHFHSVFLALAVFVFFKYNFNLNSRVLAYISSCSLGVYLIHKLVMSYELIAFDIQADNFYWRFLGAFLTYFICLGIVAFVKKIPIVRFIFP